MAEIVSQSARILIMTEAMTGFPGQLYMVIYHPACPAPPARASTPCDLCLGSSFHEAHFCSTICFHLTALYINVLYFSRSIELSLFIPSHYCIEISSLIIFSWVSGKEKTRFMLSILDLQRSTEIHQHTSTFHTEQSRRDDME
ncbi:hypothetical protein ZEAMMB73_Zm00001d013606 [Zea mays]|uniref:Uncharacterized protein n=1 Tax=Zea mays TaxID=4577 RepID=A0A1D6GKW3_MAIZE|nr:hypothetical protein ZEAMMB73_Zm00001d013606 [Zea mays]